MAEKLTFYTIVLDGIDKSGKDTIAKYIYQLDKRLNILVRGWPSLVAYSTKYNRNCVYDLPYKNALYVYCNVERNDWLIRCKINNENMEELNYDYDKHMFDAAFDILEKNKYHTLRINTTLHTPYSLAKEIVNTVLKLNALKEE